MAGFNEEKFRASAKAAGYSDEEINSELKGTAAPVGAAPPPTMDDTFADKEKAMREEYDRKVKKATTSEVGIGDYKFEVPSFFTSPAGIVTAVGAGIGLGSSLYGAGSVAPKIYQAVKDRWMTKVPEIDRTVDIPFEAAPSPTPNAAPTPLQQSNLTPQEVQARADKLKVAMNPVQTIEPTPIPAPAGIPQDPIAAPAGIPASRDYFDEFNKPPGASAPEAMAKSAGPVVPSAAPQSPVTQQVTETLQDLMKEPVAGPKGSVKPTLSPAQAGIPMPVGVGTGDNWLFNTLGPEKYKAFINDTNAGQPFGNRYEAARTAYQAYYPGPKIPGNIAQERNIPRPPTNFGVIPPGMETAGPPTAENLEALKKPVKPPKGAAGQKGNISTGQALNMLGNVLGIAGLAQSFKQGKETGDWSDFGLGAIGQVLGNVAPKAGLGFSLMAPSPLGAGTLDSPEAQELMARNYNAGGGRGIAPPSAYKR